MEQQIIFRANQEQQAEDHTDLQDFVRASLDHVVNDAVTASRRYAGFDVTASAQAEVTVASGRMYGADGAVYGRTTSTVQSLLADLAAVSQRIISVSAYGAENETQIETRDFLNDVETGATEPDSVAMRLSRDAVLAFTTGTESADPQPPSLPVEHVEIARVLVDNLGVVSVTMLTANEVKSTENLDQRTKNLEAFRAAAEPQIGSLGSDLAALTNRVDNAARGRDLSRLFEDVARVKEVLEIPDTASDYGADRFLNTDESDTADAGGYGYDALVEEGIRFADANADESEISIFSANDPAAALSNGLLLPAHSETLRISVDVYHSDLGLAQYGFQTHDIVQKSMSRSRIRYGSIRTVCTNGTWWQSGQYDSAAGTFKKDGETFEVLDYDRNLHGNGHEFVRIKQMWVDDYEDPYWDYVKTDYQINGAQVAQSFLNTNDMWAKKFAFWLTSKAAAENIFLSLVEVVAGVPDPSRAILHMTVDEADLVVNGWTEVELPATFLKAGGRYAWLLTSNANHQIGMAFGQDYVDGTFFYSTDGAFYQGELTKDMMFQMWGAKFDAPQVTIELDPLNLDGGMTALDIMADMVVPDSTQVIFECRPGGTGEWRPIDPSDLAVFQGTPVLAHHRVRFVGTRDIQAAIRLTGSRIRVTRPKTAFTHASTTITLAAPSDTITVKCLLEEFDDTPHDFSLTLRHAGGTENPDAVTDAALPDLPNTANRIERTFSFQIGGGPISAFELVATGATNSAASTFHVAERVHYAV